MATSLVVSTSPPTFLHHPLPRTRRTQSCNIPNTPALTGSTVILTIHTPSRLPVPHRLRWGRPLPSPLWRGHAYRSSAGDTDASTSSSDGDGEVLVGEDSASFVLGEQRILSWVYFAVILGVVLFALNVVWIDPSTGFGTAFVSALGNVSDSHEVVMLLLLIIFATVHSGLACLRDAGEKLIGERAFRVLFAGISLPLAMSTIVYFINHRYDGIQLWQVQNVTGVHQLVWIFNFITFFFLYPSTFNLLEVAAVDKPKMHLWETGIMRITRHPQMVGQVMWCFSAHPMDWKLSSSCSFSWSNWAPSLRCLEWRQTVGYTLW